MLILSIIIGCVAGFLIFSAGYRLGSSKVDYSETNFMYPSTFRHMSAARRAEFLAQGGLVIDPKRIVRYGPKFEAKP